MPRLIDANNLAEYKFASDRIIPTEWQQGWNDALDFVINEVPTVDVVQCKDCIYYHKGDWYDDDVCKVHSNNDRGYCAWGERK